MLHLLRIRSTADTDLPELLARAPAMATAVAPRAGKLTHYQGEPTTAASTMWARAWCAAFGACGGCRVCDQFEAEPVDGSEQDRGGPVPALQAQHALAVEDGQPLAHSFAGVPRQRREHWAPVVGPAGPRHIEAQAISTCTRYQLTASRPLLRSVERASTHRESSAHLPVGGRLRGCSRVGPGECIVRVVGSIGTSSCRPPH